MPSINNPYLRPMIASEIFAAAFRLFRDHLTLLVMVGLVPHAVLALLLMALPLDPQISQSGAVAFIGGLIVTLIILNGLVLTALTVATAALALGEEPTLLEVYRRTLRAKPVGMMVAFLIVNFPVSLLLLTGLRSGNLVLFVLFLALALYLGGLLFPALAIVIVERAWFPKAIYRSISLGRVVWARAVGVFSFFLLISVFFPMLLLMLLIAGQVNISGPLMPLLGGIISAVTLPLGFIAIVLFYFSLRSADDQHIAALRTALEGLGKEKAVPPANGD
ncbi:MAG: hypothetical protein V3S64_16945 [bacterium]